MTITVARLPAEFAEACRGYAHKVNGEPGVPLLDDLIDELFRGVRHRLSRAEIQRRVGEMDVPPIYVKLADEMPEGTYERYQAYVVLDQLEREEGVRHTGDEHRPAA